jgi:hypothetical protein
MRVKRVLNPSAVRASLSEFMVESMGFIKQGMRRSKIDDPRHLTIGKIARTQFGRPAVTSDGPTRYEMTRPILDCDTKSKIDCIKIENHVKKHVKKGEAPVALNHVQAIVGVAAAKELEESLVAEAPPVAVLYTGDGQSVLGMAAHKDDDPEMTKEVVPTTGEFHGSGHCLFGVNEGWHDAKYGRCELP